MKRYVGTGSLQRDGREIAKAQYALIIKHSPDILTELHGSLRVSLRVPVIPTDHATLRLVLEGGKQSVSIMTSGPTVDDGAFRYDVHPALDQDADSILIAIPR
ncbi:MAG: hypothetical protein HZB53_08635 [Chloroflexi bacterium]|nr:hypothetical protein [Chloroflexota bacterium]